MPLPLPVVSRKINCRGIDKRDSTEQEVRVGRDDSRVIVGSNSFDRVGHYFGVGFMGPRVRG